MELTSGILITVENKKYMILDTIIYENEKYAFTNEIKGEEEVTENFYIFKIIGDEVSMIINEELINALLPKFQEKLKETIETEL